MVRGFAAFVWAAASSLAAPALAAPAPAAPSLAAPALAAPPPLEAYGKLPGVSQVTLSPSGERYAFVADVGQGQQLFVLNFAGKALIKMDIGALKLRGLKWAGENLVMLDLSKTVDVGPDYTKSKQELLSVVVVNVAMRKSFAVFGNNSSVNPVVFGEYGVAQMKGRWYGFFGGETLEYVRSGNGDVRYANSETDGDVMYINTDLYRVDLESGALNLVSHGERGSLDWLVGSDGEVIARSTRNEKSGDWRVTGGRAGGRELARGHSKQGGASILGLGRAGDSILIRRPVDDRWETDDVPLSGGAVTTVADANAETGFIFDDTTRRWIGRAADGDEPIYSLFSPVSDARVRSARKAFSGYFTRLVNQSDDFSRMVVFTDGKDDSGTYWIVDIATKSADPLGRPYPNVGTADVGSTRMIDYKAADGLALRGVLTLPPGRAAKSLPLVVMPHGGPGARDYPGFDWWAQAYASRGYAVFQPNFRGSTGYGDKLRDAGDGEWGRKMQTDISDGAAELAKQGFVDPKRSCIVGWSYGGYAALAGVTVQHGLYRCAVSMAGVSDVGAMYSADAQESAYSEDVTASLKAQLGDRAGWRAISPAKLAYKADAPILLIHGKDDTVVPIKQSDLMENALRSAGKPVERLTLTGGDHWLLKEDTRIAMIKASVAFVEKYNPPDAAAPSH